MTDYYRRIIITIGQVLLLIRKRLGNICSRKCQGRDSMKTTLRLSQGKVVKDREVLYPGLANRTIQNQWINNKGDLYLRDNTE